MVLDKTDNLFLVEDWIKNLDEPFDRNNAGIEEPDNLGQVLFLISLVSDSTLPLVEMVPDTIPEFMKGNYIEGLTDFAFHPVHQTKWLKFGLKAIGMPDTNEIPHIVDSYSSLFWMDFQEYHISDSGIGISED